ncbi:hypothetical protein QTP88_015969 [Uroleucon formosanum]
MGLCPQPTLASYWTKDTLYASNIPDFMKRKRFELILRTFHCCNNNMCPPVGFKIYAGKEADKVQSVSTKVVLEMAEDYLDMGRTMYTDNWYSSYRLAIELLNRKTHLVGIFRSNRKNNPKEVIQKKLKKGDYIAKQCNKGVTVLKWRDKRDVLVISTKHKASMVSVTNNYGKEIQKPNIIIDY